MTDHAEALAKALEAARDQFRRYGDIVISGDEAEAYLAYLATPAPVAGTEPAGEVVEAARADLIARLTDCLDCARDDWEGQNGEIIDKTDPHWSVEARRLIPEAALRDQAEA